MTLKQPKFEWSWNIGHVLTILAMVAGFLVFGAGAISYYKDQQARTDQRFDDVLRVIQKIQASGDQDRKDIDANQAAALARTTAYAPKLEAMERSQEVQDTRISALSESIRSLRDVVSELAKVSSQTHEDIAVMRIQMQNKEQQGPHG